MRLIGQATAVVLRDVAKWVIKYGGALEFPTVGRLHVRCGDVVARLRFKNHDGRQECFLTAITERNGVFVQGQECNELDRALRSLREELATMLRTVDGVCWFLEEGE